MARRGIKMPKSKETDVKINHLALIPDGNRRWSRNNHINILGGYSKGINKFLEFCGWSKEVGISTLTVWALSTENLRNRSRHELMVLYHLYARAARSKDVLNRLDRDQIRFKIIGNLKVLPKGLRDALHALEVRTRRYSNFTVNMLVNYGGRDDLVHAVKYLSAHKGSKVTEEEIQEHLRSADLPEVDLIVRTSGEQRVSGLLPWQAAYSELYFADKYWPDFQKGDFKRAIASFSKRQRRYGK
jgi:undecaprenyl diphosphate synthase